MKYLTLTDRMFYVLLLCASIVCFCGCEKPPAEMPIKTGIVEKVDITGNYGKYVIVNTDGKRELLWWRTVSDIDELWEKAKLGEELECHE